MKEDQKFVVIMLGSVGAGKGTQARLVAKEYGLVHLETNKIILKKFETSPDDPEVKEAKIKYDSGEIIPPPTAAKWVKEKIEVLFPKEKGIVFDGSPRSILEAEILTPFLESLYGKDNIKAINIKISPEEAIRRINLRRFCSKCRRPVMPDVKVCPNCGNKGFTTREIDKPEITRKRIEVYERDTKPVLDYFKKQGMLKEINGEQGIGDVFEDILGTIK